jgi:hypothetical protein
MFPISFVWFNLNRGQALVRARCHTLQLICRNVDPMLLNSRIRGIRRPSLKLDNMSFTIRRDKRGGGFKGTYLIAASLTSRLCYHRLRRRNFLGRQMVGRLDRCRPAFYVHRWTCPRWAPVLGPLSWQDLLKMRKNW